MIDNKTIRKVIMLNKCLKGGSPTYENREASGAVANFTTNVVMPFVSLDCEILPIQEGTGTPSPSNPRPISGTSVLNVEQIQNQLIYATAEDSGTVSGITWSFSNGYLKLKGTSTASISLVFNLSDSVNLNPSDNRILFNNTADNSGVFVLFRRGTSIIHYWGMSPANRIGINWTDTGNENIDNVMVSITPNNTLNNFVVFPCLMLKTEEPTTTPIALGRTVYGGSAEVVGGTGEETHGIVDLGDLTWTYRTDFLSVPCFLSSDISDIKSGTLPLACSCFKIMSPNRTAIDGNYQVSIGNNTNAKYLVIKYDEYTDGTAVKTALTGQKLVYELATPTDFTFTGQPINSLLGANNVWTDVGDTKVTYKYKTGEGGSSNKKYLPIFYDLYGEEKYHDHS